jgi:aspartate-semialdehyde dehydrogenase
MAKQQGPFFALVGAQTLLGRELRDLATSSGLPLRSFDTADNEGNALNQTLVRGADGDLEFLEPIDPAAIAQAETVFLTGSAEDAQRTLRMNPRRLIDLTGTLQATPGPRFSAVPHAGSLLLASVFSRLGALAPIARSIVNLLQPASEWGAPALYELQQQTTALLSFQTLKKDVFDTQAAFALLSGFGEESPLKLSALRDRILAETTAPHLSLRVSHAPVFHGLTASVYVEFAASPNWDVLVNTLDPAPDNVSIAGEESVQIGNMERDPRHPLAAWFWAAADNHRLVARYALNLAIDIEKSV